MYTNLHWFGHLYGYNHILIQQEAKKELTSIRYLYGYNHTLIQQEPTT